MAAQSASNSNTQTTAADETRRSEPRILQGFWSTVCVKCTDLVCHLAVGPQDIQTVNHSPRCNYPIAVGHWQQNSLCAGRQPRCIAFSKSRQSARGPSLVLTATAERTLLNPDSLLCVGVESATVHTWMELAPCPSGHGLTLYLKQIGIDSASPAAYRIKTECEVGAGEHTTSCSMFTAAVRYWQGCIGLQW